MAYSREDFQAALATRILAKPVAAEFYRAQDPRLLAQLDAVATMMAMLSQQHDVQSYEPFLKVRDATVLADATLKGILPLARAAQVRLNVKNNNGASYALATGRRVVDPKGRVYYVDAGGNVGAGATVQFTLTQKNVREVSHEVLAGAPFYRIPVPASANGQFLCALQVSKGVDVFEYRPDYFNVAPDDLAFQAETDEYRNLFVALGKDTVVGYEAQTGDVFDLEITECEGRVNDLASGASFALEYVLTVPDGNIELKLDAVLDEGENPPDMATLRVHARYPALYDHDAVYLGNFDFLLRRYLGQVVFLSVWNEQIEERVRGPDVDNINKLFVAGLVTGMSNPVFQTRVTELVRRADDSYKVVFVPKVDYPVPMTIVATVSVVHDLAETEAQIRAAILAKYGSGSPDVSKGLNNPINLQATYELLKSQIPALKDAISDLRITVTPPATQLPEQFLFVSNGSLTVTVEHASYNIGLWNN